MSEESPRKLFCPIARQYCSEEGCVFWTKEYEECLLLEFVIDFINVKLSDSSD